MVLPMVIPIFQGGGNEMAVDTGYPHPYKRPPEIDPELEREVQDWGKEIEEAVEKNRIDEFFENNVLEIARKQSLLSGNEWETTGYELTLAFGGPGIWFNTWDCEVEGHWAGKHAYKKLRRETCDVIDEYLDDIYGR